MKPEHKIKRDPSKPRTTKKIPAPKPQDEADPPPPTKPPDS